MFLIQYIKRMPTATPGLSAVCTGIMAIAVFISGISFAVSSGQIGQSVFPGVLFALLGVALMGFVGYAAYNTNFFRNWTNANGGYSHAIVRWLGPVAIILGIILFAVMLQIMWIAFKQSFLNEK